jgi:NADH:ubiquinone oxidoreductase subunit F (NADH-binding)
MMVWPTATSWLLAGPTRAERWGEHVARLGTCPPGGSDTIALLYRSGLRGRGGARFPTWRKWEAVAARSSRRAVLVVNGAEGEPASGKDRSLLELRPHLVLDGALLAAGAVGASQVVFYVNRAFHDAMAALAGALQERSRDLAGPLSVRVVDAPPRYIAGEETAVVGLLDRGVAKPSVVPPRPFEKGVGGRPTLVQNVETLAMSALIARFGATWFRCAGTGHSPGQLLLTIGGAVASPGVHEVPHGVALADAVRHAGGDPGSAPAILLGGYFGRWVAGCWADRVRLDDAELSQQGLALGCGVVWVLAEHECGVSETARILRFLAGESAGQCGPCIHGLPAMAGLAERLAVGRGTADDTATLARWSGQLGAGRGACKHPDGAAGLLRSALDVFPAEFRRHAAGAPCHGVRYPSRLPVTPAPGGWA